MNKIVLNSYFKAFIYVAPCVISAHILASKINSLHLFDAYIIGWTQSLCFIPGAVALFGQLGWEHQTWDGRSHNEIWNQRFANILNYLSLILLVFASQLKP